MTPSLAHHSDSSEAVAHVVDRACPIASIADFRQRQADAVWTRDDAAALVEFGQFVAVALGVGGARGKDKQDQNRSHPSNLGSREISRNLNVGEPEFALVRADLECS